MILVSWTRRMGSSPLSQPVGIIRVRCVLTETVSCWGSDEDGRLDAPDGEFTAVAAGYGFSCALRTDGTVSCWGSNSRGLTWAPDGEFTAVAAGEDHLCALRTDGTVSCWGSNYYVD